MLDNRVQNQNKHITGMERAKFLNSASSCPIVPHDKVHSNKVHFAGTAPLYAPSLKITNPADRQMYNDLCNFLDKSGKLQLEALLTTGRLLSKKSNDGSSTLQNLYKIMKEPRAQGLDNGKILQQTINTIANPFSITQKFGKIPDFLTAPILEAEKLNNNTALNFSQTQAANPIAAVNPEDLDVKNGSACVAASIEFNLADKSPAEYARYAAGLTSPDLAVKSKIKFKDIAPTLPEALDILEKFKIEKKPLDWENIEVTLRPDRNAIIRARVQQSQYRKPGSRSCIDALMQSTFLQMGSANGYNSLSDKRRSTAFSLNPEGLSEVEKTFVESIVNGENGGKSLITYHEIENNDFKGYAKDPKGNAYSPENIKKQLLDTLDSGSNVIVGMIDYKKNKIATKEGHDYLIVKSKTASDGKKYYIGVNLKEQDAPPIEIKADEVEVKLNGHECTLIGYKVKEDGKLYFIRKDTDDDEKGPIETPADELIPKIHHAGIPTRLLDIDMDKLPDPGFEVLKQLDEMKKNEINENIRLQLKLKLISNLIRI